MPTIPSRPTRFLVKSRTNDARHLDYVVEQSKKDSSIQLEEIKGPSSRPELLVISTTPERARQLQHEAKKALKAQESPLLIEPDAVLIPSHPSSRTDTESESMPTRPNGHGPHPSPGAPARSVSSRHEQYLIAKRSGPLPAGTEPIVFDVVLQALHKDPSVQVKKVLKAPGVGPRAQGGENEQAVAVAVLPPDRANMLRRLPQVICEPDHLLRFGDLAIPGVGFVDPGVIVPMGTGLTVQLTVLGKEGAPVAGAMVNLFGTIWPAQGITDDKGKVTLTLQGESASSLRALYVKPTSDYWSIWIPEPALSPDQDNTIQLVPLSQAGSEFPKEELVGWGQRAMRLDAVPAQFRGQGIKVAVVDSGTATTHPDLQRVHEGFDTITQKPEGWTQDTISHGSHCSGIIAGSVNGTGIRGFAPDAELISIKIFPEGRYSNLIDALNFAIAQQVDVVNLSLGSDQLSEVVEQKILEARESGVACIVAAGNSGGPVQFPASSRNVLAISAIGKLGEFPQGSYHGETVLNDATARVTPEGYFSAKFTCFGPEIGLCAPGVAIISSVPPDRFAAWDGTSMAAPHVTGLAALVLAHHPDFQGPFQARNSARVDRLFEILRQSADPIQVGDPRRTGAGLPNAVKALAPALLGAGHHGLMAGPEPRAVIDRLRTLLDQAGLLEETDQGLS